jgi:hypothetical protein
MIKKDLTESVFGILKPQDLTTVGLRRKQRRSQVGSSGFWLGWLRGGVIISIWDYSWQDKFGREDSEFSTDCPEQMVPVGHTGVSKM